MVKWVLVSSSIVRAVWGSLYWGTEIGAKIGYDTVLRFW